MQKTGISPGGRRRPGCDPRRVDGRAPAVGWRLQKLVAAVLTRRRRRRGSSPRPRGAAAVALAACIRYVLEPQVSGSAQQRTDDNCPRLEHQNQLKVSLDAEAGSKSDPLNKFDQLHLLLDQCSVLWCHAQHLLAPGEAYCLDQLRKPGWGH